MTQYPFPQNPPGGGPPPIIPVQEPPESRATWVFRTLFILAVAGTLVAGVVGGSVFWYFSKDLPPILNVADYRPMTVTRVIGNNGVIAASGPAGAPAPEAKPSAAPSAAAQPGGPVAAAAAMKPSVPPSDEELLGEFYKQRRYLVPYDRIPEVVVKAFISAEDDQFFEHPGINVASIIRAAIANFKAGHKVQGGSTITQQVAKMLLLTPAQDYTRKIKEAILASRFEKNMSKQDILYLYLNEMYLGHGAYGVQAAAKTYFRKDISQVTLPEAAILAGLPQAPSKYSPVLAPHKAKERQRYVLRRMYETGAITEPQLREALNTPVRIYDDENLNLKYAGHLIEHIRRVVQEKYGEKAVWEDGLTIQVPASRALSMAAAKSLRDGLRNVDKGLGYRGPIRKLKPEEVDGFVKESKVKLIGKKIGYVVLLPDGKVDALEAMREAGIQTEDQLLDVGEIYEGLVTAVDDKKKLAEVTLGPVKTTLTFDRMKWAKPYREATPGKGPEPSYPSRVLSRGDVILAKYLGVPEKEKIPGFHVSLEQEPQVEGALISIDAKTGYVMAMEGGFGYNQSQFNRATQAQRQPGSAFKPFIYAAGLEKGYTPATIIVDAPLVYEDSESGKWKPTNFEEKFYGDTTFRQALIKSRNVPTIKIVQTVQVGSMIDYARRLGLTGHFNQDLSISLGSGSTSLIELTRAYALFPRLGRKVDALFYTKILDRDGRTLEELTPKPLPAEVRIPPLPAPVETPAPAVAEATPGASPLPVPSAAPTQTTEQLKPIPLPSYPPADDPDQVMDPRVAYVMTHLMKEVVNYGTGYEARSLGRAAAGKTGTTNEYNDAWFMGFTPQVVTGVWVGFDNQRQMGSTGTGAKAALPIWLGYMTEAVKSYPEGDFPVPPGVVFASIDPNTGKLAPSNSSRSIKEAFIEGTQPTESSDPLSSRQEGQTEFFKEDLE